MDASALPGRPAYVRRSRAGLRIASDKRLVALVRAGEAVAFETLYDRHARKLLSFCRHMLGSRQDGEDALQRTFASAYRALLVDEREIDLRPWLFAIARNECLSILRQRHPTGELDGAEPATEGLSSRVEGREDLRDLLADLRALPERQRAALLLSELGGFTHAQIAEAVGARPEQIKAYVFQARSNLIAERDARQRSCVEVREQLASTRGAALLQRELSRHLRRCRGCREYSVALRRQRQALAIVLPVAPSLALRSAVLRAALGSAHGTGTSTGIAGAGLAITNTGGKALLTKGLAVIALAGVSAGAGTLALHAVSRHHPRATAPPTARAGSPDRVLMSARRPVTPPRSPRSSTLPAPLPRGVAPAAARSDQLRPGTFGPVAASGTRPPTPTPMGPAPRTAPAAGRQDPGAGARSQPGLVPASAGARAQPSLVPASAGAPQTEPGSSSHSRAPERGAANAGSAKEHVGVRGGSVSPSAGRGEHGMDTNSQPLGAAGSSASAEGIESTPGHAYGQETDGSAPPGQETGAVSGMGGAPGNSASAPGRSR